MDGRRRSGSDGEDELNVLGGRMNLKFWTGGCTTGPRSDRREDGRRRSGSDGEDELKVLDWRMYYRP